MGLSVLLFLQSAWAEPPQRSQRAAVLAPGVQTISPVATAAPTPEHRWLHPSGPEPVPWDGDWPEQDMDLTLSPDPVGPRIPLALDVRLCWCPELHRSARSLPGAGIGDAWEDAAVSD